MLFLTLYYLWFKVAVVKDKMPLSIKLDKELHQRLIQVGEKLGIPKHRLAEMAIEAATQAIERNGYRLVVPIEFEVTHIATERPAKVSSPAKKEGTADSFLDKVGEDLRERAKGGGGHHKPRQ